MTDLEDLKLLFDFTDADIAANRDGRLSDRQLTIYRQLRVTANTTRLATLLTFAMVLVTFVVYIVFSLAYGNQLGPLVLVALVIWLALAYVLSRLITKTAPLISRLFGLNTHPQPPALQQTTGRLRFRNDGEHQHMMLGELELSSSAAADKDSRLWKLQEKQVYTIYYVEEPLWIAAIEAV